MKAICHLRDQKNRDAVRFVCQMVAGLFCSAGLVLYPAAIFIAGLWGEEMEKEVVALSGAYFLAVGGLAGALLTKSGLNRDADKK